MTEAPKFQEKEEGATFSSSSATPEDSGGTWLLPGLATPEEVQKTDFSVEVGRFGGCCPRCCSLEDSIPA